MSIRYLKTFITICERGSFAAAARYLNLTQSAVSMQIKALEDELSTELFDRAKRPPQLTEAANTLLPKAQSAIAAYDELRSAPGSNSQENLAANLRIGAVPSVMTGILPKALVALKVKHPRAHVELTMGLSAELVEQIANDDLDAAILSNLAAVPKGLIWSPFTREPLVLIVPIDAPEQTPEQFLRSYPFIRYTRKAWVGQLIDKFLKRRRFKINETMTLDTLEAITTMVYHGLGVSIVPLRAVENPLPLPVRQLPLGKPAAYRTLGLLEPRKHDNKPSTAALLAELKALTARARQPHQLTPARQRKKPARAARARRQKP